MTTNQNNISAFEAGSIAVAALGLALIGTEIFIAMPAHTRIEVASAFNVLDMHQQVATVANTAEFSFSVAQDFMNQFNLAFNQTMSFPDQIGTPLIKFADSFSSYSQTIAVAYQSSVAAEPNGGEVLGAMFVNDAQATPTDYSSANLNSTSIVKHEGKQYYYQAPSVVSHIMQGN